MTWYRAVNCGFKVIHILRQALNTLPPYHSRQSYPWTWDFQFGIPLRLLLRVPVAEHVGACYYSHARHSTLHWTVLFHRAVVHETGQNTYNMAIAKNTGICSWITSRNLAHHLDLASITAMYVAVRPGYWLLNGAFLIVVLLSPCLLIVPWMAVCSSSALAWEIYQRGQSYHRVDCW